VGKVAALFVQEGGVYYGLPDVDPWPESRDARLYAGPYPVVAHPDCRRWGRYYAGSPYAVARGQRLEKGDDDGCFEAALNAVRTYGGVLEHPWGSSAWRHFGLRFPPRNGGWVAADFEGGWTCYVEQGFYGHFSRKPTWLVAYGARELPSLRWGVGAQRLDAADIEKYGYEKARKRGVMVKVGGGGDAVAREATPLPFRDILLDIARSVEPERLGGFSGRPATA